MTDKWRNSRYENNMSTKEGDIIIQRAKLLFNLSEEEGFFFRLFKKKIVLPSWKKFVTPFSFEWKLQGIIFPKWWKNVERRVGICFCVKKHFYYNVYTSSMIEWIKWKIKNTTMSEQFRIRASIRFSVHRIHIFHDPFLRRGR
jgi:hypothetical protein